MGLSTASTIVLSRHRWQNGAVGNQRVHEAHDSSASNQQVPNPRPFSRFKKRRRTAAVSSNQYLVHSHEIDEDLCPYRKPIHPRAVAQSIVNDILNQALEFSLICGPREDFVPECITSLPHFVADLGKRGYLYTMQHYRTVSRRKTHRVSARLCCMNHKKPWKCTAAFTANLRVDSTAWELKGLLKHSHPRRKPQPNVWRERLESISTSITKQSESNFQNQTTTTSSQSVLLTLLFPLPQTRFASTATLLSTRSISGPNLQPRVLLPASLPDTALRISSLPTLTPPLISTITSGAPPTEGKRSASRSLPLLAPRAPYVILTQNGPVLVAPPSLPRAASSESDVAKLNE